MAIMWRRVLTDQVGGAAAAEERQQGVELAGLVTVGEGVEEVVSHHVEPRDPLLFPFTAAALRRRGKVGEGEVARRGR
jgi:hypothetical protein